MGTGGPEGIRDGRWIKREESWTVKKERKKRRKWKRKRKRKEAAKTKKK